MRTKVKVCRDASAGLNVCAGVLNHCVLFCSGETRETFTFSLVSAQNSGGYTREESERENVE